MNEIRKDGPAPMTPVEPIVLFRPPLILQAHSRGRLARATDAVITGVLWLGWAALLVMAAGALGLAPLLGLAGDGGRSRLLLDMLLFCLAGGAALSSWLALRALREQRRFREERRQAAAPVTAADLAERFDMPEAEIAAAQSARRVVAHHAEDGKLVRLDTDPAASPTAPPRAPAG
jgi:poly-beta-1,6-N-acetyl-D-glucosamine biosynthesis protein PgaD